MRALNPDVPLPLHKGLLDEGKAVAGVLGCPNLPTEVAINGARTKTARCARAFREAAVLVTHATIFDNDGYDLLRRYPALPWLMSAPTVQVGDLHPLNPAYARGPQTDLSITKISPRDAHVTLQDSVARHNTTYHI